MNILKRYTILLTTTILCLSFITAYILKFNRNQNQSNQPKDISVTQPIKLNWFIQVFWYNKKWDSKTTLYDKTVTEKTGVDLNLIIPARDSNEKLIAMATSGDLPDIITIDNWNDVREQMLKEGYFQPLNKLAKQYSPELLEIIPESIKKWYTQEDGNLYGIANKITAPEWISNNNKVDNANGIVARKDIMKKLGIKAEDFNTQKGTIKALKKVKESNIEFNGEKVFPFYLDWNDWNMARMWGIPWETPHGDWIDYKIHPKYLEMYQFLNKLWLEGLISKDNFTNWSGEKITQGACFAYLGNLDNVTDSMANLHNLNSEAMYMPVGPIHALDGSDSLYDQAGTGWTTTFITKNCKYPEQAIKLLSFLASDAGQMLTWYGIEGQTYKMINNKVQYTNEYLRMKKEDPKMALKVYGINDFWPLKQPMFNDKFIDKEALPEVDKNYENILKYFSKFSVSTPETMGVKSEPGTVEVGIQQKVDDYWENQTRKMVMASSSEEVSNIYNESIKYIYAVGYQKVYDASNAKFKAQKKKMGKQYSYPANKK